MPEGSREISPDKAIRIMLFRLHCTIFERHLHDLKIDMRPDHLRSVDNQIQNHLKNAIRSQAAFETIFRSKQRIFSHVGLSREFDDADQIFRDYLGGLEFIQKCVVNCDHGPNGLRVAPSAEEAIAKGLRAYLNEFCEIILERITCLRTQLGSEDSLFHATLKSSKNDHQRTGGTIAVDHNGEGGGRLSDADAVFAGSPLQHQEANNGQ